MSLEKNTRKAFAWSLVERVGTQAIRLGFQIIIARLLLPADFGYFGILTAFLSIGEILSQSGLALPLIRDPNPTHLDKCSVFYFSLSIAAALTVLFCLFAPLIAAFYQSPNLIALLRVASLGMLLNAFGVVPGALLMKEMRFADLGLSTMTSNLVSGLVGTTMALKGCGVWSLVVASLGGALLRSVMLWSKCDWRPTKEYNWRALKRFLSLGFSLSGISLVEALVNNVYYAVLGRLVSAPDVGLYSRAKQIQEFPVQNFYYVVSRPSISIFARFQDDREKLCQYFRSASSVFAMINFPVMCALAVIAKPLVLVLLTSKWIGAVPFVQLFCLAGAFYPLQRIIFNLLVTLGHSGMAIKLELWRNALMIVSILAAARFGITAIIAGQVLVSVGTYIFAACLAALAIGFSVSRQLLVILPHIFVSAAMGTAMYALGCLVSLSPIWLLIVQLLIGLAVYGALSGILRIHVLAELRTLLRTGGAE